VRNQAVNGRFEEVDMSITPEERTTYEDLRGDTVRVHVDGKSEVLGSLLLVDILVMCGGPLICYRYLLMCTFAFS
jgi:hypothetical protein